MSRPSRLPSVNLSLLVALLILVACATTRQAPGSAEPSGFLRDYSTLRPGGEGEAQLVYVNPDAQWTRYDAILIDSVTLWRNAVTDDVPPEEAQQLTDLLYAALHEELGEDWRIVEQPGPNVLRLRAALTEAKGSKVVMDTVTSVIPQFRMLANLGGMATGTATLVGKAGVEAELTDSLTGQRLAAAVDERQGTKAVRGGIGKWTDAQLAFEFWAKRLRERLAEMRGQ